MEDQTLDLIEKRVSAIELQVFGKSKIDLSKKNNVIDLLLQTNTMTDAALCCRENIVATLQKMHLLNEYLNPTYGDDYLDVDAKRQYVTELYSEVKEAIQLVKKAQELQQYSESPEFTKLVDYSDKLQTKTIAALDIRQSSIDVEEKNLKLLAQFVEFTTNLKTLLAQMELQLQRIEISKTPKQSFDE